MNIQLFDTISKINSKNRAVSLLFEFLDTQNNKKSIKHAIEFASNAHKGQTRKSGEEYIVHPILAAVIVAYISKDDDMIIAAILHDVVEDTPYTLKDISALYGEHIANLVDGLTKITEIKDEHKFSAQSDKKQLVVALNFRKMLIASIKDIRVLIIKLCDRVHNLLTLDALSEKKRIKIAQETLLVFAPIAHRLGASMLKNILEDRSFYYLLPKQYKLIDEYIAKNKTFLIQKMNIFKDELKNKLLHSGFDEDDFTIRSRVKHYYSIYHKMQRKGINIDEILDILAIRLILKEPNDCYKALGIIHQNYRPIMARFKDYIALPKENGYQTIHTTVFTKSDIYEVQIRTNLMHQNAEYGLASHYSYKKGGSQTNSVKWLKSLEYSSKDITKFYELATNDLYSDDIVIISPDGDNWTLPRSAIALDFAYTIHSDIGNKAAIAYINGEKKSLLTMLNNGDTVRIETAKEPIFRCSWLDNVKTSKAKEAIKNLCKNKIKEINFKTNINILSNLFSDNKDTIRELLNSDETLKEKLHSDVNTFKGFKELKTQIREYLKSKSSFLERLKLSVSSLKKKEIDNFKIYTSGYVSSAVFDYCCHPKPRDEIVAFKFGKRVVVHHKLCSEASKLIDDNQEMVFIEWNEDDRDRYSVIISLENKRGALAEYLNHLSKHNMNLNRLQLGDNSKEFISYCQIEIDTDITDTQKLHTILSKGAKLIEIRETNDAYNK